MEWDENAFQARILARADELGMSVREIMRTAGLAEDTFNHEPKKDGRSYRTIEALARAVKWTVAQALGEIGGLQEDLLRMAVVTAVRAVRSDRLELLPDAVISAYDSLSERRRDGPIEPRDLAMLEASLRAQNKGR